MSSEGSNRAVIAALLANSGIAMATFVGFGIAGSSTHCPSSRMSPLVRSSTAGR